MMLCLKPMSPFTRWFRRPTSLGSPGEIQPGQYRDEETFVSRSKGGVRDRWAFFISLLYTSFVDPRDGPSRTFFSAYSAAFAVIVIDGSFFGFPVHLDGQIRTVVVTPHAKSA